MFKDTLKQIMDEKGIKAATLSAMTGIGKSSISQYLSGKYIPNEKKQIQIAKALELPGNYFQTAETEEGKIKNVSVRMAAKILGQGRKTIERALQNGDAPYGYAVKMPSGKYSYYISPYQLKQLTGIDVNRM